MPFGPRVLLTRSPTAIAPTKAESRAFSPFSSVTSSAKIWVGLKAAYILLLQERLLGLGAADHFLKFEWAQEFCFASPSSDVFIR